MNFSSLILALLLIFPIFGRAQTTPISQEGLQSLFQPVHSVSNQITYPTKIGIELEGQIPKTEGWKAVKRVLRSHLEMQSPGKVATIQEKSEWIEHLEDYRKRIYMEIEGSPFKWEIHEDRSIKPIKGYTGVEVVTHPWKNPAGVKHYFQGVEELVKIGFLPELKSSGIHINVNFPDPTVEEVANLVKAFILFQNDLFNMVSVKESRLPYTKKIDQKLLDSIDLISSESLTVEEFMQRVVPTKYFALNLVAVINRGAAEFRFLNSSLSSTEILAMSEFLSHLVRAVRERDPKLMRLLIDPSSYQRLGFKRALPGGNSYHFLQKSYCAAAMSGIRF